MLYFIPTPIGNLEDITFRSLNILFGVSTIFAEDTRNAKKLLNLLSQKFNKSPKVSRFIAFHSHNEEEVLAKLSMEDFTQDVAFISDAGMPAISDPGASLVKFAQIKGISYEFLPGANALLLAYASSGYAQTQFTFFGFLPHKSSLREAKLDEILSHCYNGILYESPHRIDDLLQRLCQKAPNRKIFAIKEISKMHESKFYGSASEVYTQIKNSSIKGEWVVVISHEENHKGEALNLSDIENLDIKPKIKAKLLAKLLGRDPKEIYQELTKN